MHEENTTEKDSFTSKEKALAIKMFCAQVVYLLIFCIWHFFIWPQFRQVFLSLGFESITDMIFSFGFIGGLTAILALLIYPASCILSLCVFMWAYVTGNLQNSKVHFMCILPLIVIGIIIVLHNLPRHCSHYPGFM